MLLPSSFIPDTVIAYIPKLRAGVYWLFCIVFVCIAVLLFSLHHIYTDISVKSIGITRPSSERTEVKSTMGGLIKNIYFDRGEKGRKRNVPVSLSSMLMGLTK